MRRLRPQYDHPSSVGPVAALALVLAGCGDDAGAGGGAGVVDASPDAGVSSPSDAGPADAEPGDAEAPVDLGSEDLGSEDLGPMDLGSDPDLGSNRDAGGPSLPYAETVVRFTPGDNAGFGQDDLPDVVLGPPMGRGPQAGSLDVLSLGVGGEIVLDFGGRAVIDGPGPDLVVFENPFWVGNDPSTVFAELGEVSVSEDGMTWTRFACDTAGAGMGRFPGCAGWTPTLMYDPAALIPLDAALSGGDAFDLAELGVDRARFVRIRDLSASGAGQTGGFDLDAVGAVHLEP